MPLFTEFNKPTNIEGKEINRISFFYMIEALKHSLKGKNAFAWNKEYDKSNNKLIKEILKKWLRNKCQ